jgi:aminoglycoside 2'-N-acetyltransferase I
MSNSGGGLVLTGTLIEGSSGVKHRKLGQRGRRDMSIGTDILSGDAAWKEVEPLYQAVWPPEIVAKLPWAGIVSAHADLRIVVRDEADDVVCHVGIYHREARWNGRKVTAGGIGGVLTREDKRRRGYTSIALGAAVRALNDEGSADFALLFCEPRHAPFYIARGWVRFEGQIFAEQPGRQISFTAITPYVFDLRRKLRQGTIDLCGLPW